MFARGFFYKKQFTIRFFYDIMYLVKFGVCKNARKENSLKMGVLKENRR